MQNSLGRTDATGYTEISRTLRDGMKFTLLVNDENEIYMDADEEYTVPSTDSQYIPEIVLSLRAQTSQATSQPSPENIPQGGSTFTPDLRSVTDFFKGLYDSLFNPSNIVAEKQPSILLNIPSDDECVPFTCDFLGKECGRWADGCGGAVICEPCPPNYACSNGHCIK